MSAIHSPFASSVWWGFASIGLALQVATGDTFFLNNGGSLEGKWLNAASEPPDQYEIRTAQGVRLVLAKSLVRKVVTQTDAQVAYGELLARMPETADGHWQMAEWCREQKLSAERTFHLQQIVRLEPNHKLARDALQQRRIGDEWLESDDWLRKRGYHWHQGVWITRLEADQMEADKQAESAVRTWRTKIQKLRRGLQDSRNSADLRQEILSIDDPLAAPALAAILRDEDLVENKELWLDVLIKLDAPGLADVLVDCVRDDPDADIRRRCIEALQQEPYRLFAVRRLIGDLQSKDLGRIDRAAVALHELNATHVVMPLIQALTLTEKRVIAGGDGQIATSFGSGGIGFQTGSRRRVQTTVHENASVLKALSHFTGENFGFDQEAWLEWLATVQSPRINLRRD